MQEALFTEKSLLNQAVFFIVVQCVANSLVLKRKSQLHGFLLTLICKCTLSKQL